jgi:hypothetical protein
MKKSKCVNCEKEFEHHPYSTSGKYCSNACQGKHRQKEWFEKNRSLFESGKLKSRAAYKRFVLERDGPECSICNQGPEHNGKPLTMVIDHIDGDASNNIPSNFRLVCPNCDSQLPTFKGANRGKGRATKGMKWYSPL